MWDSFIEAVTKVNDWVNGVVWGLPMIIMILGTGHFAHRKNKGIAGTQVRRIYEQHHCSCRKGYEKKQKGQG